MRNRLEQPRPLDLPPEDIASIRVYGQLIGPMQRPEAYLNIFMKAITTNQLIIQDTWSQCTTDSTGNYDFTLTPGKYAVFFERNNVKQRVKNIEIYSDSAPGDLQSFMLSPAPETLTPLTVMEVKSAVELTAAGVVRARQWAENPVNLAVLDFEQGAGPEYSAYHWASKAKDFANAQYQMIDSFQTGAQVPNYELTNRNQALHWPEPEGTGDYYRWDGPLPKQVPPNSTPDSTGGVGLGLWVDITDATLRSELARAPGAGMIGMDPNADYPPDTVGALLQEALIKPPTDIIYATMNEGIIADGITDVSAQIVPFLTKYKGKHIIFDGSQYLFAGAVLSGSGWEGTTIEFRGKHKLKPNTVTNDAPDNTPGYGFWAGFVLTKDVNELTLVYRGDGNRSQQYDREHIFNVAILGATNIHIPFARCDEIMGDGFYVNSHDQNDANAQNSTNINFGTVIGKNSAVSGRNLVTIASCNRGGIDFLISENIGGVVGGLQQPGGFDMEPNPLPGALVRDFITEVAIAIGAGGVYMVADWNQNPKKIQNCHVRKAIVRGGQKIRLYGADQSSINGECTDLPGDGPAVEGCTNSSVELRVLGADTAAFFGTQSQNYGCTLKLFARNIRNAGLIVAGSDGGDFDLDFDGWTANESGNMIGLWLRDLNKIGGMVLRNNRFKIRCPKSSNVNYAIQYSSDLPISFLGENILSSESIFTDWPDFTHVTGAAGLYLTKEGKIPFLTTNSTTPNNGSWKRGDFVYYTNPSATNLYLGFIRLTDGTQNVNGVDWGTATFLL